MSPVMKAREPRDGGDPAIAVLRGVPAHVVEVQVGAEHGVDRLAREARVREIDEEARVRREQVEARQLVLAHAGVDQDAPRPRLDHQRVDRQHEAAVRVEEVRLEPAPMPGQCRRGRVRQQALRRQRHLAFDHARDGDVADPPAQIAHVASARSGTGYTRTRAARPPFVAAGRIPSRV
jgi:hypothetical protein